MGAVGRLGRGQPGAQSRMPPDRRGDAVEERLLTRQHPGGERYVGILLEGVGFARRSTPLGVHPLTSAVPATSPSAARLDSTRRASREVVGTGVSLAT